MKVGTFTDGAIQGCNKKFYQPGDHKLQVGRVLLRRSGGMLLQRILKVKGLRLAKNAFLAF